VEMETEEAAEEAIRRFNGGQLLGNTIAVSEARPKKEGVGGGPRGKADGAAASEADGAAERGAAIN